MTTPPVSACPCGAYHDPPAITNIPGLSSISYRVADFAEFREALLRPLEGEVALDPWAPVPGDLGLQVLEWWAYMADILTFYNERIANESYLRTAQDPAHLADLVGLIGYKPAPGVAATGTVAALRTQTHPQEPVVIPTSMPISSTATPGVPAQVFEAAGPLTFEGPSNLPVALPPDTDMVLSQGNPLSVLLSGKVTGLNPGDQLLLVPYGWSGADDDWAWVTVTSTAPATDPATGKTNTLVTFSGTAPFGAVSAPKSWYAIETEHAMYEGLDVMEEAHSGFAEEKESAVEYMYSPSSHEAKASGYESEAVESGITVGGDLIDDGTDWGISWYPGESSPPPTPAKPVLACTSYQLLKPVSSASLWSQTSVPTHDSVVSGSSSSATVHLGSTYKVSTGDLVLFDGGPSGPIALGVLSGHSEQMWTIPYPTPSGDTAPIPPTMVIAHSALTVNTMDYPVLEAAGDPSTISARTNFKPVGRIIGVPKPQLSALPATVGVPTQFVAPAGSTPAIVQDAVGNGVAVEMVTAGSGALLLNPVPLPGSPASSTPTVVSLDPPLQVPLQLLLDLVPVSRGVTVTGEVLGSGDATQIGQTFTLQKSPLTFLESTDGNGLQSTLTVYVNGIAWSEVPSFYAQLPSAAVFVVDVDSTGTTTVRFGDGINGARLPTGSGNVVANYRYGSGAAMPPPGRLTTITKPQPNLASIANPIGVTGGADPQSPADVRIDAPASVFTFGRAISGLDYQVVAAQAPQVARASAVWSFDFTRQRTVVTVYVGDDAGALSSASAALAGAEDPNRPVVVLAATAVPISISGTLIVDPTYETTVVLAAATAALNDPDVGLFAPSNMAIGARLYRSRIDRALVVPGVTGIHGLVVTLPEGHLIELMDELLDPGTGNFFTIGSLIITTSTGSATTDD